MSSEFEHTVDQHREAADLPYPRSLPPIHAVFQAVARAHPDALALSAGSVEITYAELNRRANLLAQRLADLGVTRGTIVGLCMERSPELIVGMLAILKAGGAYLPLEPATPDRRLALMLQDSAAELVLVHPPTVARFSALNLSLPWFSVENQGAIDGNDALAKFDSHRFIDSDDLAYVMYTSGSSGIPKGVRIPHRGVVRLVKETNYCEFGPSEVFLQLAPISFDASTFEIWGPLLNGGRLAIMPPGLPSLDQIGQALQREHVTTLWLTSGLFQLMVDQRPEDLRGLRQLLAGGDILSPSHVRKALAVLDGGVVINGYGPTESTTFACCYRISSPEQVGARVPIGLPICKTTLHVLDENFSPMPEETVGELWIGGQGVALGYLNDLELTREKFIADPFSTTPNALLYRTGDLVRKRSDGIFEFIGRVDDQVKILGHRIEPAEIEKALLEHPEVRAAAVIPWEFEHGEKRLVGYVIADRPVDALKAYVAETLPSAWIPSCIMRVDSFPLTANGKLDRAALPKPKQDAPVATPCDANGSKVDPRIVPIWEKALGVKVGTDDNFFDLGGDSLLLIEVHAELQKALGQTISLLELFEYPTTKALSDRLAKTEPIKPRFDEVNQRAAQHKEAMARSKALRQCEKIPFTT